MLYHKASIWDVLHDTVNLYFKDDFDNDVDQLKMVGI